MYVNQEFTKGISNEVTSMEKEHSITLIIGYIKGNGLTGYYQVMESLLGQMAIDIKVSIEMG
jgi:hypothetical protein